MSAIVYAAPGLFDMGGIARYGRYQVAALRELRVRENIDVLSMLGPGTGGFDEPFSVDFAAGGTGINHKLRFLAAIARRVQHRAVYWAGHLNYAPLVLGCARASRGASVVNIYGMEVWSRPSIVKSRALLQSWVVSDCHATLDVACKAGMVNRERSIVIWDPVDTRVYHPAAPDQDVADRYGLAIDDRFRVMFLGRLSTGAEHKSPDALIRCFARARLPPKAELIIAGAGDRSAVLRDLADSAGVGDRVRFLGRIPDRDLAPLYRLASIFVLVSRMYDGGGEGIPLTPLEAAACGVPIVVGNEDGSREACVDGETGFILPSRDEDALVSLLESAASDRARLRRVGSAGVRFMQERFTFDRFVKEHAEFFARIEDSIRSGERIAA